MRSRCKEVVSSSSHDLRFWLLNLGVVIPWLVNHDTHGELVHVYIYIYNICKPNLVGLSVYFICLVVCFICVVVSIVHVFFHFI